MSIRRRKPLSSSFSPGTFLFVLFFLIVVISIVLSISNFIRYKQLLGQYNEMKKYVDNKVKSLSEEVSNVKDIFGPNSLLDKYIASVNYLRDFGYDFEKILANLYDDPTTGYFRIFVAGNQSSWFTIKEGDNVAFSKELRPGLSEYRFFYFKEPRIKTNYDIIVKRDATIIVGKAGSVYLLFFGVGTSFHPTKVVQVTETTVPNFAEKYSLYIPR